MSIAPPVIADSIAQALLAEFEQQAAITRRFLERLPADKLTWKPHEKSMTAGQLAYHLASLPGGIIHLVQSNPVEIHNLPTFPQPATCAECLKAFDESIAAVRKGLQALDDSAMNEVWRLSIAGHQVVAQPRQQFIRDVMFSHWYQHRGQFSVYLRLLNVPVPASFGPSADEPPLFMQK